jgi:hypothetical protein
LIESLLPDYFRCVAGILDPLNEVERTTLVSLLQKIQHGLAPQDASVESASAIEGTAPAVIVLAPV